MGFHYGCSFNFQQLLKLVYLLLLNLVFTRQHYKLFKYVLIVRVHCEIQTIKTLGEDKEELGSSGATLVRTLVAKDRKIKSRAFMKSSVTTLVETLARRTCNHERGKVQV